MLQALALGIGKSRSKVGFGVEGEVPVKACRWLMLSKTQVQFTLPNALS